jgi:dihydrofolate reductase
MGRVIVEQIVSTDGFAADSSGGIDFFMTNDDFAHSQGEQLEVLENVRAIVFGATTYRMFADYWPQADPTKEPVATPINSLPKHVFSNTLEAAPWADGEAILERGDAVERLPALLEQYDGDLIVWGSLTLTDALFRAGLVDVLRLRTLPVLLGEGRSIAPADLPQTPLTLQRAETYEGGMLSLTYSVG